MRLEDARNYAPMPKHRYDALMDAARGVKEEPVKRKHISAVLIAAALIVLLAATALAVANRAGLMEFFQSWTEREIPVVPKEITYALTGEDALLRMEYDDFIVTVPEAMAEGDDYYFNTTLELKPGVRGRLVDMLMPELTANAEAANDLPVYYVDTCVVYGNRLDDMADRKANEDGSISTISYLSIDEAADTAQMYYRIAYVRTGPGEAPDGTAPKVAYLPFTIPMPEAKETRVLAEPVRLDDLGIVVDELYFKLVGMKGLCYAFLRCEGGEAVDYMMPWYNGMAFRLRDRSGGVMANSMNVSWQHGSYATGGATLYGAYVNGWSYREMDALPDSVILEVYSAETGKVYGSAEVRLTTGTLDLERLAPYWESPEDVRDYRDLILPGEAYPRIGPSYLSTEDAGGVQLYRDPTDPASLIGHYYSGLKVDPNIRYGEWTTVSFGDSWPTGMHGYVRSEYVQGDADAVRAGIPVAKILGQTGAHTDVRVRADAMSTITAKVDAGETVYAVGEADGWVHIAREERAVDRTVMRIIGFVPKEALALTGERVTME